MKMKNISLGVALLGFILVLGACGDNKLADSPPYECSIAESFALANNLSIDKMEFSAFERQKRNKRLTIEGCGFSLSGMKETPDTLIENFFHDWTMNEENTLGRGSVNLMGFEKEGLVCLSESHIQLSLEQINDDANLPEELDHTLRLSCGYPPSEPAT